MTTTMQSEWAEVQSLVLRAASDLEQARVILRGRAARPGEGQDWLVAQEMTDFLAVVADGAWSVRAQIAAARKVLVEAERRAVAYQVARESERSRRAATTEVPDR